MARTLVGPASILFALVFSLAVANPAAADSKPTPPTTLAASALSASQIKLTWVDKSNNESGFQIGRWNGLDWVQIATVGPNVTTFTDKGLSAATAYTYEVGAVNSAGTSWAASTASATTLAVTPKAPTLAGSVVTASDTQIKLTWTEAANTVPLTGFQIARWSGSAWVQIARVGPTVLAYTNTGLSIATAYSYRVGAFNASGTAWSSSVSVTTPAATQNAPSGLKGVVPAGSDTQINLSWTETKNAAPLTAFQIARWNGTTWAPLATVGPTVLAYNNAGLSPATAYSYKVGACNSAGIAWSSSVTVTTPAATLNAPSSLKAVLHPTSNAQIDLSWTETGNGAPLKGFLIARWTGTVWVQIATVGPTVLAFADPGRSAATAYTYKVGAYNSAGIAWSSTVAVTTP